MELHALATDTALTLWWEQPEQSPANAEYTVLLSGKAVCQVRRIHCTVDALQPDIAYRAQVLMGGKEMGSATVRTLSTLARRLDVTAFGAVGDGETLNTKALQAAIDACGKAEEVYIPRDTFLTGGLRLHSDMRFHLAEGAVLQGADNPEDCLPKIPSRFEGTEIMCCQSLLNLGEMDYQAGPNCRNVLICRQDVICGGGQGRFLHIIVGSASWSCGQGTTPHLDY